MIIFENIKTTVIGLLFIFLAIFFEWENWIMFSFIGIGICLLFAKDKIPTAIQSVIDKFLSK